MHPLLTLQIRQLLGENPALIRELAPLFEEISKTYVQHDKDKEHFDYLSDPRSYELNENYQSLKQQAENSVKFQKAVESSTDGICITSVTGQMVYTNPTFEHLFGFSPHEALGQNIRNCASAETKDLVLESLSQSIAKGTAFHSDDIVCMRKDGSTFWADFILYPVLDAGKASFMVVALHDVTQRKTIEQSKTEFVSLSSHQLRTPLTAVRWILDMFVGGKSGGTLTPAQLDLLSDARTYTLHMMEMISTMLMISRIEGQKIEVDVNPFPIATLLDELKKENLFLSAKKEQKLMIGCDADLNIITDKKILKEILTNLISNAIKYTPNKGLIHLAAWKDESKIHFELRDNGVGIPTYQQQKVFTKFYRGDNVVQNQVEGTGLGLYLVRQLTGLLGGTIHFTSEVNKGSIFSLTLPASPLFHV
ncbi:MAG: PAS domain S-box protein [Candidatus Peribacteraceae bacterium]|nr:PAS domain S-box protein [Candidatus Peribacteraceae bacterium]